MFIKKVFRSTQRAFVLFLHSHYIVFIPFLHVMQNYNLVKGRVSIKLPETSARQEEGRERLVTIIKSHLKKDYVGQNLLQRLVEESYTTVIFEFLVLIGQLMDFLLRRL